MKKILFVISTLHGGGAERTLCNLTKGLPEEVEVDILVNWEEPEKDYEHRGNVISVAKPSDRFFRIPYPIKLSVLKYFKLKKLKKKNHYDACISFMEDSNIINILTGNKYCKNVISIRCNLSKVNDASYVRKIKIAKHLYSRADRVVAISKGVEEDLKDNFGIDERKITTIYNGHDCKNITEKSKEESIIEFDSDLFYFVNMGRLCDQKGQWHLIKVFKEVVKIHPEARLVICGDGEYKLYLAEIVDKLQLKEYVIFTGFVKNPFAISDKCDVFVFSSLYEGLANVIIENLICGAPIITSDYESGAREILAPDTDYKYKNYDEVEYAKYGVIVPVCSGNKEQVFGELEKEEELLLQAMLEMIESENIRKDYKKKALERGSFFDIRNIARQWMDFVYKE